MIDQLSAAYNSKEDRILFRFNTTNKEEYSLWLSRRITQKIMDTMPRHTQEGLINYKKIRNDHDVSANASSRQMPNMETQGINSPSETLEDSQYKKQKDIFKDGQIFPIGKDPILVIDFQSKQTDENFSITFLLNDNRKISLRITKPLFVSLHSLLEVVLGKVDWMIADNSDTSFSHKNLN